MAWTLLSKEAICPTRGEVSESRLFAKLLKDNHMLPGEMAERLNMLEGVVLHLTEDLFLRHFVNGEDGHLLVLHAEFDENHAPTWFEGVYHGHRHLVGMGELVVDVHQEKKVR